MSERLFYWCLIFQLISFRPLHHTTPRPSFNVLSNLQRLRQQLEETHERVLFRSGRLHRLRRRINSMNSRAIISDGPLVTDDMLVQSPEPDIVVTPEMTSADDSVMVINEVSIFLHLVFQLYFLLWI